MLTKQIREMERQAESIEQGKRNDGMLKLSDLWNHHDGMYYVGDIVDLDGNNWVNKDMAQQIIDQLNIDYIS
mgnify:CR=1 FL=1